jgi:ABC-type branched-subunit amino acid transport system permease subunit
MVMGLRWAGYVGLIATLLALSGIFISFGSRDVITGILTLNSVLIGGLFVTAGLLAAQKTNASSVRAVLLGCIGGLIVGLPLVMLVVLERSVDLRFVFANLTEPISDTLLFSLDFIPGIVALLLVSVLLGAVGGWLGGGMPNVRRITVLSAFALVVIALIADQLDSVIAPVDGFVVGLALLFGYISSDIFGRDSFWVRLLLGIFNGAAIGIIAALVVDNAGLAEGSLLRIGHVAPAILTVAPGNSMLVLPLMLGAFGALGALLRSTPRMISTFVHYGAVAVSILTLLAMRRGFDLLDAVVILVASAAAFAFLPRRIEDSAQQFQKLTEFQGRIVRVVVYLALILLLLIAPAFLGQYITNVLNLVGLYIIMGIGLNIVVGNAGLLDLGYVAFFAIGAYTIGLLTTPNALTCGGIDPSALTSDAIQATCTGIMSFWGAWGIAIVVSGLGGVVLGTPVLRLRGDYLAIVTLGFGEIIRIVLRFDDFSPVFGAAQGIANIPRPVIDLAAFNPAWRVTLDSEASIYYLILVSIGVVVFVASHLANSRIGRAWRAIRADEDVAQAMGIHLTRAKLLAFAIGASFAGLGGAISATRLFGAYPDSFTLLVSINVLSLVIIGGMGSIPGVILGAFVLIGLPEVLRELTDYRLLAFGLLLVYTMLARPQGLYPETLSRLSLGRQPS